jgi:hypothetical protein
MSGNDAVVALCDRIPLSLTGLPKTAQNRRWKDATQCFGVFVAMLFGNASNRGDRNALDSTSVQVRLGLVVLLARPEIFGR